MPRSKEEQRLYMREYRAKKSAGAAAPEAAPIKTNVVTLPLGRVPAPGEFVITRETVEAGIRREIEKMPNAKNHPGIVQAILACARVLDDNGAMPQRASNAKVLAEMMAKLQGVEVAGGNKLTQLRNRRKEESAEAIGF